MKGQETLSFAIVGFIVKNMIFQIPELDKKSLSLINNLWSKMQSPTQ